MVIQKFVIDDFTYDMKYMKQGSQACVFKGSHFHHGEVAIKTWTDTRDVKNREVELLMQFLGILINDESKCIGYVMPYMPSGSLEDVIHDKSQKYGQNQIKSWITQICHGLAYLHSKNIIHRDIKPSNILLGKSRDDVKLSDFGIARSVGNIVSTLTKGLGTPFYMAPEMLDGESYTTSADIYSLSITIWEILHRRNPFDHVKCLTKFEEYEFLNSVHKRGERPQLNNNLSKEMSDLLTSCWHADASKRPTIDYILQLYFNIKSKASEKETILLLGGYDGKNSDSLLILENNRQNWKQLNIKLPYGVWNHGAQFLNNNLYIFGGWNPINGYLNCTHKLSSSLQWEKMADMNQKRSGISNGNVILNNQIWVCGGRYGNSDFKSVEMYDPENNEWKYMKEMNESRCRAAAAVVNGKIFCTGDTYNGFTLRRVECYDPSSDVWTQFCHIPQNLHGYCAVEIDGNLILMGGKKESMLYPWYFNIVSALDVMNENPTWIDKTSMPTRRECSGIAKIDGKVFVCGGCRSGDSVDIFDGEVWKKGPKMPSRRGHAPAVVISMEFARDLEQFTAAPMQVDSTKDESSRCCIQ